MMDPSLGDSHELLREAVGFHGHLCPGLLIGYRAALLGLNRLGGERAEDEELVAVVENDSCAVDGIQFVTGCTFGKGNLIFRDWGKQVFTLAYRPEGQGVRLSFRRDSLKSQKNDGPTDRATYIRLLLDTPDEELFKVEEVKIELPPTARIFASLPCESCGEPTMEPRMVRVGGRKICLDCLFKGNSNVTFKQVANFLFEAGMLKKTPRSGYQFLGNGSESVAEHSFRATILGFILAGLTPGADRVKVVNLCLFHDFHEARTG
ncbi:MAG: HD domain-containing protein, partial [Deltaproteobacteria bacterium]|nr:HD domain-containing protein [Deltaproteobacteria bacterium]